MGELGYVSPRILVINNSMNSIGGTTMYNDYLH